MSIQMSLTTRQQYVLWATVKHYIATAEPVGSKVLVDEYNLNVSPATIRNAMGYLEKAGLLYQPHTSAGRVPSDSGYRIYVDELITPSDPLARQVDKMLRERLNWERWTFEALLRGAAQILAALSGYIALVTVPHTSNEQLLHLQLLRVEQGKVKVILVTDSGQSESVSMDLPQSFQEPEADPEIIARELEMVSNFLNSKLRGQALTQLSKLDWSELGREFERYGELMSAWLEDLQNRALIPENTGIVISGISEVLRQPEFSELNQLQMLMHLLEDKQDQLWPLIFEPPGMEKSSRRANVRIGAENPMDAMRACTLISASYCRGEVPVGSVGVLGPTRMIYENAIAAVEAAADYLSSALS